jgi:hypothetical protein
MIQSAVRAFIIIRKCCSETSEEETESEVNYLANVIKFLSGKLTFTLTTINGSVAYVTLKKNFPL